jgi:NNP family nitrate/nitrite transporter-like MFS transporter
LANPAMRVFHVSWMALFCSFFAWFSVAPLMGVIRDELKLTKDQVGWTIIGSVAATVLARVVAGRLCDTWGPHRTYRLILFCGAALLVGISMSYDFTSFLLLRVALGTIGAGFVVSQYHTSRVFAANCVGTANATVAGWGNLGNGLAQVLMPLLYTALVLLTGETRWSWRLAIVGPAVACCVMAIVYQRCAPDVPRTRDKSRPTAPVSSLRSVLRDGRVWALAVMYATSFGVELTMNNVAALYFLDYFTVLREMPVTRAMTFAGCLAALFNVMNIFARTLGGWIADWWGLSRGIRGRVQWLFLINCAQGIALLVFSQMRDLGPAVAILLVFSVLIKMAQGATFAVVPVVIPGAVGAVTGVVSAGGNVGAVLAGFLFRGEALSWPVAFFLLGLVITMASFVVLAVRFDRQPEANTTESQVAPHVGAAGVYS